MRDNYETNKGYNLNIIYKALYIIYSENLHNTTDY